MEQTKISSKVPNHVAIIMDGNGRWANAQGIPRTAGHQQGEKALIDVIAGALEIGIKHLSVYAFSTENWGRSVDEVRFIMGYSRKVLRERRDILNAWGVKICWVGRPQRLWKSVIKEIDSAQKLTANNSKITLYMCLNYGGRQEIVDAMAKIAQEVESGRLSARKVSEKLISNYLYIPEMPPVDLLWRTGGEERTSNFLPWQAVYAELVFTEDPWPLATKETIKQVCEEFAKRDRRWGKAVDRPQKQ